MNIKILVFVKLIIIKNFYINFLVKLLELEVVGYSFIELIFVVLIIGIFVAIVVFVWLGFINNECFCIFNNRIY